MRDTKLILLDGLPGSGKSTTAEYLAARIRQCGSAVRLLMEVQEDHPLNVGGPLHPAGETTGEALFARYTTESYVEESLRRWEKFVSLAETVGTVHVVESYPYQNSVRILLQMNADPRLLRDYARDVEKTIQPLQPVLLYFDHRDVDRVITNISERRGREWTGYGIRVVTKCPYARERRLEGFPGVLTMMRDYKALMDALLRESSLPTLTLEDCSDRWESCYRQIESFLALPPD